MYKENVKYRNEEKVEKVDTILNSEMICNIVDEFSVKVWKKSRHATLVNVTRTIVHFIDESYLKMINHYDSLNDVSFGNIKWLILDLEKSLNIYGQFEFSFMLDFIEKLSDYKFRAFIEYFDIIGYRMNENETNGTVKEIVNSSEDDF